MRITTNLFNTYSGNQSPPATASLPCHHRRVTLYKIPQLWLSPLQMKSPLHFRLTMSILIHKDWRRLMDLLTSILPGRRRRKPHKPRYTVENPQVIFCQKIHPDALCELLERKFQKSFFVQMQNDVYRIHAPRHLAMVSHLCGSWR